MREPDKDSRKKALTLMAMSLGFVVVQLDVTVVNVALQSIGTSMGGGVAGLQWVVNAYTIAFASLILTAGAAGDRFGARRVFIAGFAVFMAGSLVCALAPSLGVLIAARVTQGIGAAILVPSSLALLNHAFVGDQERTRAVAIWAAGASAGLAAGPVVGGLLIAAIGWRSIFFINLPLGLFGIWLTWRYAEETTQTGDRQLDVPGQVFAIVALADLAAATIAGGKLGWTHPLVLTGLAFFVAAAAAFVIRETKAQSPMLPLSIFRNRIFSAATLIGLLINIAFYGLIFVFSLFFQQIKGYDALKTGLAFLPMTAVLLVTNLFASRLSAKFGARVPIFVGQTIFLAGCLSLIKMNGETPYAAMMLQLLAIGGGLGLLVPPMTSVLLGTVKKEQSGIASGVLNSARQAGSVVGVALFGSFIGQKAHFLTGLHLALVISTLLPLIGCGLAFFIRVSPRRHQASSQSMEREPSRVA